VSIAGIRVEPDANFGEESLELSSAHALESRAPRPQKSRCGVRQDKRARHRRRVKPMSAHGFLQHVENHHRAAEDCKLLMAAGIPRVIHAGVRLNSMILAAARSLR
jgi:hypothetical protein